MKVGDKIKFAFASDEREGVIEKISPKRVFMRVNFPHDPNKLVIRRISDIEAGSSSAKKKKEKEKKKKK
jgi:hypothetical protein